MTSSPRRSGKENAALLAGKENTTSDTAEITESTGFFGSPMQPKKTSKEEDRKRRLIEAKDKHAESLGSAAKPRPGDPARAASSADFVRLGGWSAQQDGVKDLHEFFNGQRGGKHGDRLQALVDLSAGQGGLLAMLGDVRARPPFEKNGSRAQRARTRPGIHPRRQ